MRPPFDPSLLLGVLLLAAGCADKATDADGDGFLSPGPDCDDQAALISPAATEVCDGVDNNCDGSIDEGVQMPFWADADGDGAGDEATMVEACEAPEGHVDNDLDCNDGEPSARTGASELCDGLDNDCDGEVDEDDALDATTWFADTDGDGHGDPLTQATACTAPSGFVATPSDCDDGTADRSPDADERCNELDDDCDGAVDEDDAVDAPTWFIDYDGDGWGGTTHTQVQCEPPRWYVDNDLDCDDTDRFVSPDAVEVCDGIDNDCDTDLDESDAADAVDWFRDSDEDGYGDAGDRAPACAAPSGYVANATDCDDSAASVHPGADEQCNGVDDDCDGTLDEDDATDATTWYLDGDADGYGDPDSPILACDAPSGAVADNSDCDDDNELVSPAETEVCNNGLDDDCDGTSNSCLRTGTLTPSDADAIGTGPSTSLTGFAVSGSEDLTADGWTDILVGAPSVDAVWIWSGPHSGTTDLSARALRIQGSADAAGSAVTGLGDIDGDGIPDLMVGGPDASGTQTGQGAAWLLLGPVTADRSLTDADAILFGVQAGDAAGTSVTLLGDSDGDGSAELAIGGDGGVVWVVDSSTRSSHSLGNADARIRGDAGFGASVLGAVDTNGDGLDDLFVGSDQDTGRLSMFSGPIASSLDASDADQSWTGDASGDQLGAAMAGAGDVDGDGYSDLLVGSPGDDTNGDNAGMVYLLHGPATTAGSPSSIASAMFMGETGDEAGAAVAVGDLDGDGEADFVLGQPGDASGGTDAGAATLFYGPVSGAMSVGDGDAVIVGDTADGRLGAALSCGLDLNGDRLDDLLLGGPADTGSGSALLFFGGGQ